MGLNFNSWVSCTFFFLGDTANGIRMRLNVGGVTNYVVHLNYQWRRIYTYEHWVEDEMVVAGVRTITNAAAWPSIHPNPAQILRSVQIHLNWYRPTQNRFLPIQISNQKMPLLCTVTKKRKKKDTLPRKQILFRNECDLILILCGWFKIIKCAITRLVWQRLSRFNGSFTRTS